jgi:predicted nucleic-acid-binding protein
MRAIDTNVLVRLLTRDDERQAVAAETFVAAGAWVPHLALAETTWVLSSVYRRNPREIAAAIDMLLSHEHLTLQDADAVAAAVEHFRKRPAIGLSDCLVLEIARKAGHLPLGTFDRTLGKLHGAEKL